MRTVKSESVKLGKSKAHDWDYSGVFIDWLSIRAENEGRWPAINSGHLISIDEHGELEYEIGKTKGIEGSYDSRASLRITEDYLELSINPSRFNRNDNLFGCRYEKAIEICNDLLEDLALKPLQEFVLTRVDVTLNVTTGSKDKLATYIRYLKKQTLPRKKTYTKYESAIFQNKRLKITVYPKGQEIRDHNVITYKSTEAQADYITERLALADWCDKQGLARVEVRIGRKALKGYGLRDGSELTHEMFKKVFISEVSAMPKESKEMNLEELNDGELGSYLMWKNGHDPRHKVSKPTFYKRRRSILQKIGVDIGSEDFRDDDEKEIEFKTKAAKMPENYELPLSKADRKKTKLKLVKTVNKT